MGQYLQPISSWARAILEERENNKLMSLYRTPFVVMSSAAFVTKLPPKSESETVKQFEDKITDIIENGSQTTNSYKGCIISNNINDLALSYSPNETPVGVDFDGKVIKVEGEIGRKVSTPIIISVDVDTEEANNTIKTTRIGVRCFTLKQLEMFEMFFMKPGMSVMVEWGDSSLLKRDIFKSNLKLEYWDIDTRTNRPIIPLNSTTEALFVKQYSKWDDYCENFSKVFVPNTKSLIQILKKIRSTIGSYDFAAGKISDYTYSVNEDGTYDITLTIFQMNQVSLAVPVKPSKNGTAKPPNPKQKKKRGSTNTSNTVSDNIEKIRQKILIDFNIEDKSGDLIKYKDHWFNFFQKDDKQQNTQCSIDPYISLEFILKYLVNDPVIVQTDTEFKFNLPEYKEVGNTTATPINIIPFTYDKNLISSNEDILFPVNPLPQFELDNKKTPSKATKIEINTNTKINGTINGKSILLDKEYELIGPLSYEGGKTKKENTANALNCFLSYKRVLGLWVKSVTRVDFIKSVLEIVNTNSYGLMNLVLAPPIQGLPVTVICSRYAPDDIKKFLETSPPPYRFKPNTINSTVKNFSLNFQMDNLMASRTMFNNSARLREAFEKKNNKDNQQAIKSGTLEFPSENYRYSADFSKYANADNFFAINWADKMAQEKIWQDYQKKYSMGLTGSQSTGEIEGIEPKKTDTSGSFSDYVIQSKSVKFNSNVSKNPITLVYKDKSLIQDKILKFDDRKDVKSILTNVTVSLTIDGFSGLRAGEIFHIDGVPEIYNKNGAFQIINIKHNITADEGWYTTIEAGWRVMTI